MTPTSFDIPSTLRERLAEVMKGAVIETFHVVFGVDAAAGELSQCPSSDGDLVCLVKLVQNDLEFKIYFRFAHNLLSPIVANFYPAEVVQEESAYQDAASEIANIVGCNLKAFLNAQGYHLEMEIPSSETIENASKHDANAMQLCFSAFSEVFSVNLRLTERDVLCA
ncbi:MAG: hypothetical protein U1E36_00730 [Rickettsiales bacterium]